MAINAPPEKRKNRTSDNVIYIGAERKDRIDQMTIEISYSTKKKVSTARFPLLIDHYGENAKNEFIEAIIKSDDS
ncbi:hypothetical protein K8P97_29650 [Klebsiella pneumoniae]